VTAPAEPPFDWDALWQEILRRIRRRAPARRHPARCACGQPLAAHRDLCHADVVGLRWHGRHEQAEADLERSVRVEGHATAALRAALRDGPVRRL
jgi:hypothetical protein